MRCICCGHAGMTENQISFMLRKVIIDVYEEFGPGLFEKVYELAILHKLRSKNIQVQNQVFLPVIVDDVKIDSGYRIDLLIEDKVLVEIKSVEAIAKVHHMQTLTYLRLSGIKLGILVNFNTDDILKSIVRKVNGL